MERGMEGERKGRRERQGMKEEGREGGNYKWHKHLWDLNAETYLLFMQTETVEKPVY